MKTKGKESNPEGIFNVFRLTNKPLLFGLLIFLLSFQCSICVQAINFDLISAGNRTPAPIILNLTPSGNNMGGTFSLALLEWNVVDISKSGRYFIEREESGTWINIGNIQYTAPDSPNLSYTDTISYPHCSPSVLQYRIRFEDGSSSSAYSNIATSSSFFQDMTDPENVRNNVVSITPGEYPILTWQKARDKDIEKYRIYKFNGIIYQQVDSVNAQTTSYIDTKGKNACDTSYAYAIVSVDSCGHTSYGNYPEVVDHRRGSIVLNFSGMNPCDRSVRLSWNPYYTMPGGLGGYRIYMINNNDTTLIKTNDSLTTSYTHVYPYINSNSYFYFIEAYSVDRTLKSVSCPKGGTYTGSVIPDSLSIINATVVNNSFVLIRYHYDPENTAQVIILERSETVDGPFMQIDSVSAYGAGYLPTEGEFEDHTARINEQSYYYRLAIKDRNCQLVVPYSGAYARTILLTCNIINQNISISWNDYEGWPLGVKRYDIYKQVYGSPGGAIFLASVSSPSSNNFTDISGTPDNATMYWVEAIKEEDETVKSISNFSSCTSQIPNAFIPSSNNNNAFRLIDLQYKPGSFTMLIFNKWGQQIFETLESKVGWDGKVNGTNAPMGVYAYYIKYTTLSGQNIVLHGTVALIR